MPSKKALVTTGFLESLDSAIAGNSADIAAAGLDVAALRARIGASKTAVVATDTAKDSAQRVAQQATAAADGAEQHGYDDGSSVVDAVAGAVGKKSPLGQQILAIRSDANKRRKSKTAPPTP